MGKRQYIVALQGTMVDFLRRKARALRQSAKLCMLVVLALLCTTLTNGIVLGYLCVAWWYIKTNGDETLLGSIFLIGSAIGTLVSACIVTFGIVQAKIQSKRGGAGIAIALGGKRVAEVAPSRELQRLRGVAEEMAIAYSLPMPELYVLLGQRGINAFAAGYSPSTAVIGVTEGCVKHLSRDQLQGVIAHEFSHISSGDMRLNMRLNAIVHGLCCITSVAEWLIDYGQELIKHRSRDKDNDGPGLGLLAIGIGFAMWPVGFAGSVCSSLLVLAVSRQREYLADARAVEATRNPQGLAQALRRIAGYEGGSCLKSRGARSVAYMMFANACGGHFDLLASHPPLDRRILALDPQWDHSPLFEDRDQLEEYTGAFSESMEAIGGTSFLATSQSNNMASPSAKVAINQSNAPGEEVAKFDGELAGIDAGLIQVIADPLATTASIPLLLFAHHPRILEAQSKMPSEQLCELFATLRPLIEPLDERRRTSLLNQALRVLKGAPADARGRFNLVVQQLQSLTEKSDWSIHPWLWLARHYCAGAKIAPAKAKYGKIAQLTESVLEVLSLASQIDGRDAMAEYRFKRGWAQIGLDHDASSLPPELLDWNDALRALDEFAKASPRIQRDLMVALGCAFLGDGKLSRAEIGFLRVVRIILRCEDVELIPGTSSSKRKT